MDSGEQHIPTYDKLELDRQIIRLALNEIAAEAATALREAGLNYPVYFAVPNSGNSVLTFASPLEPTDPEWLQMGMIVREIVGRKLGGIGLQSRDLSCAMSNAKMIAADVTAD